MRLSQRLIGPLAAALAVPALATFTSSPATAAVPTAPSAVEDFSYPGAAQILASQNITLKSGDGHIVLADCASGAGLVELYTRSVNPSEVCFRITGKTGYLALEIPDVYNIKADDHTLKATLNANGTSSTVDLAKNAWTPVGEGVTGNPKDKATLLELVATDGPDGPAATYPNPAVGTVTVGPAGHPGARNCTATLVAPQWLLSAASCFATNVDDLTTVPSGLPPAQTTASIGGQNFDVSALVPRTDRDLIMVRLVEPAVGITPIPVAATAPTAGEDLQLVGAGRTKTDWVPNATHSATFTAGTVAATGFDVAPKTPATATVCKGDAGGPALRAKNGGFEIAAVTSRAWQGGCLTESETRLGAGEVRVDDLAGWVATVRDHRSATANEVGGSGRLRFADFDGDGKPDYITIEDNGQVNVWLNKGGDGHGGWQLLPKVAQGVTSDRSRVRFADFDGDGRADYWVINQDNSVSVWLNRGGDGAGGWQPLGKVATGTTNNPDQVRLADFDGDGKADYVTIADSGAVNVWLNKGGDSVAGGAGWQPLGQKAVGVVSDRSRVRFADFNGDGKADYWVINPNGSNSVWLNQGGDGGGGWNGIGTVASGIITNQNNVYLTDFDGDGKADYLYNPGDGSTWAYLNKGGDVSGPNGWSSLGKVASGA
ncbi:FG-GAP-like repeat-containing protein [Streptomyces tateyamensis]|uniref:FG-GAP-like repeat-containing protein n=1 Tax=Streptomyces tateyamensis TaxID=565073 RepID=UPI0015E89001|nr:FG-GAP-like repeat-containing protein [Streptomyces tateyamensis]